MSESGGTKIDNIPRAVAEDFWRPKYGVSWIAHLEYRNASVYSLLVQLKPSREDPQEEVTQRLLLRARMEDRFWRGRPAVCQISPKIGASKNGTKEVTEQTIWHTFYRGQGLMSFMVDDKVLPLTQALAQNRTTIAQARDTKV